MSKNKDEALQQMYGFKIQEIYALELLLRLRGEEGKIAIEKFDDVCYVGLDTKWLYQLKYHKTKHNMITNASIELWKTIYNWLKKLDENTISYKDSLTLIVYQSKDLDDRNFAKKFHNTSSLVEAESIYLEVYKWYEKNYLFANTEKQIKKYLDDIFNIKNKKNVLSIIQRFKIEILREYATVDDMFHKYFYGQIKSDYFKQVSSHACKLFQDSLNSNEIEIDIQEFHNKLDQFISKITTLHKFTHKTSIEEVKSKIEESESETFQFIKQLKRLNLNDEDLLVEKTNYFRAQYDVFNYIQGDLLTSSQYEEYCENQFNGWRRLRMKYNNDTIEDARNVFFSCEKYGDYLLNEHMDIYFIMGNYHNILENKKYGLYWFKISGE